MISTDVIAVITYLKASTDLTPLQLKQYAEHFRRCTHSQAAIYLSGLEVFHTLPEILAGDYQTN
jgi:hypothetical protein